MSHKVRTSLTMDQDLHKLLLQKSKENFRSLNQEILFLIEGALMLEMEGSMNLIRALVRAQEDPAQAGT